MRTPRSWVLILTLFLVTIPKIAVAQTTQQLIQQGVAAQNAGNYAWAKAIWRQILEREPNNVDAYLGLGHSQILLANQFWS